MKGCLYAIKFFSTAKSFIQTASLITNTKFISFSPADDRDIPHLKFESSLFYENLLAWIRCRIKVNSNMSNNKRGNQLIMPYSHSHPTIDIVNVDHFCKVGCFRYEAVIKDGRHEQVFSLLEAFIRGGVIGCL